jgi:hypothetical protein
MTVAWTDARLARIWAQKSGGEAMPRRRYQIPTSIASDEVDLGREIRGNFEADFLLAYSGLGPSFHDVLHQERRGTSHPMIAKVATGYDNVQSHLRENLIRIADACPCLC